jgi:hypothetical protein
MLVAFGLSNVPGCSPFQLAKQTLHHELNQYPRFTDGKISCREYRRWAQDEWQQLAADSSDSFSPDYASGFLQGFVDQVYAGGTASPPPMPPRRYWRLPYRNERGQQAIRDWYAGFEHGARVAHDKGYRDRAVIPSSLLTGQSTAEWSQSDSGDQWPEEAAGVGPPHDELAEPPSINPPESSSRVPETFSPPSQQDRPPEIPSEPQNGVVPSDFHSPIEDAAATLPVQPAAGPARVRAEQPVSENFGSQPQRSAVTVDENAKIANQNAELLVPADTQSPPLPPWQTPRNVDKHEATGFNRSVPSKTHSGNSPAETTPNDREAFDPFAGTPFAQLSQRRSSSTHKATVSPQVLPTSPMPVTSSGQANEPLSLTMGRLGDDTPTSINPSASIRPLDVIDRIPPPADALSRSSQPQPLSAVPIEPAEKPTTRQGFVAIPEPSPLKPLEPTAEEAPWESRESVGKQSSGGWRAVEQDPPTQWKPKS